MQIQTKTPGGIPMRIQNWHKTSLMLSLGSFFLTGCFDWCPFCTKEDKKFQPKPTYSLNTLGEAPTTQPKVTTETADIPGAGAVSNIGNTLDGNPISVSNAPKVTKTPEKNPIAISNPIGDGGTSQIKFTPTPQAKKAPVHSIPTTGNETKDSKIENGPALQELGIPKTSLTPSLQPVPEIMDPEKVIPTTISNAKGNNIPAIDSVIIPPTPGMGAPRTSAPPTTILPTGGSLPTSAPLGIPSAPQGTPYR
jgi:hypothetical protein